MPAPIKAKKWGMLYDVTWTGHLRPKWSLLNAATREKANIDMQVPPRGTMVTWVATEWIPTGTELVFNYGSDDMDFDEDDDFGIVHAMDAASAFNDGTEQSSKRAKTQEQSEEAQPSVPSIVDTVPQLYEAIMTTNEAVEAASKHATSVHLGLAADSVAQADYDMASVEFVTNAWYPTSALLEDIIYWSMLVEAAWDRPVEAVPLDLLLVGELLAHGVYVSRDASDTLIEALYTEIIAPHLPEEDPLSYEGQAYLKQGRTPLRGGGGKAKAARDHAQLSRESRRRDGAGDGRGFTMTTRADVQAFLERNDITHLVVFEFSGAVVTRLARTKKAMSVDRRSAEHGGLHYRGDVRDVIDLRQWEAVYFIGPNCFQHLRRDPTLRAKKLDGRAFWGGAMVIWCLCCPYTSALVLEQPDTIVFDYIDVRVLGFEIVEFRTGLLDPDCPDKMVRLVSLNFDLSPPVPKGRQSGPSAATPRRPGMWEYPSPDERDRGRSTWANKPHSSDYVSDLRVKEKEARVVSIGYEAAIHIFSERWVADGNYLPDHFDNPTGQPLDETERAYQDVRGVGGVEAHKERHVTQALASQNPAINTW
ncbi:hypothetical protein OAO87_01445 [bacterium]|nr:hypothetical protein [bacterium]